MKILSPAMRTSIGLASLTASILFGARALGLVPDREEAVLQGRKSLCEAIAIQYSMASRLEDMSVIRAVTEVVVKRNPDLLSAAVRTTDGNLLVEVGDHLAHWSYVEEKQSNGMQVPLPITIGDQPWGDVELRFAPLRPSGMWIFLRDPGLRLIAFVISLCAILFFLYLQRIYRSSGQSDAIPGRVRNALDTLVEGVLLLDRDGKIALANQAFAQTVGQSPSDLQGRSASELPWRQPRSEEEVSEYPWSRVISKGMTEVGAVLDLRTDNAHSRTFSVNSTPIIGDDGSCRGALTTFDDMTALERKNSQLKRLLERLRGSRNEIQRKNMELESLAARDPLTQCLNRRSFFTEFETHWSAAKRYEHPLSCLMVDVDRFKSVNDTHGHSVGDQVLRQVAEVLMTTARKSDIVCRYGGEEFCILLPHVNIEEACEAAERFRRAIEARNCSDLQVTASLGVSEVSLGARGLLELLDQADKALYVAKRQGRNRAARWDKVPRDVEFSEKPEIAPVKPSRDGEAEVPIPFHAVTSLISALAHRDPGTAAHSRRVADLCVATAKGLMSESQCYVLEVAALLHDIGKLGVRDSILLKAGPLSEDEWKIMQTHDRMGVEIIGAAFASKELSELVATSHAWFGGNPRDPELPKGGDIPAGARILAMADAFDAMVSDRPYRKGMNREDAFTELRRCAGKQFDPELVERFIEVVMARDETRIGSAALVSKQTALKIGLQIEKLAGALDARDLSRLVTMAEQLKATATDCEITEIAEVAGRLRESAASDADFAHIVQLTTDLLELCRSTQNSYLQLSDTHRSKSQGGAAPESAGSDQGGAKKDVSGPAGQVGSCVA